MNTVLTLITQTLTMFLLAGVGYRLFRSGKITPEGNKVLGNLLIHIALPCVIINSFIVERTTQRMLGLLFSALGAAVILVSALSAAVILTVSILCSRIFFKKDPIGHFAAAFSNPGFFGIPLILSSIGNDGVFYVAAFIAFLNLLQWTYGVAVMTGKKGNLSIKAVLTAPFMIAIIIGLLLFFTAIPLPGVITKTLGYIKELNTPLAMFTVGVYLAQTSIKKMFVRKSLYAISAVRLLVIPIIVLLLMCLVPESWHDMKLALLLASACPVGSNVAVYAQLHEKDYPYAVETVVISTLLSIVTIPIITYLAQLLWG